MRTIQHGEYVPTLRELRHGSPYDATSVAAYLEVPRRTLYSWEVGSRTIPIDKLNQLLRLYNIDIHASQIPELTRVREEETV